MAMSLRASLARVAAQPARVGRRSVVSVQATGVINPSVKKDLDKVVDTIKADEIEGKKGVFCRCWRSAKFPYCDGKHAAHNKETGDNVGPLIIEKP
ncbi:hypothetical protein Rsub_09456 [Raphidocelis subcapitata]|uniref:Iron-binding zinc finger CDGSH type domain-containing protein n=1 Tax=Raphidocelis subcapitata TaxID=307507 RepID=A0A2V0PA40_9CHLO|nr:hypothetical protein Rsub_09456 [Raphidocelis subcapitata]|eukprot:GBF96714.1 hypothetical protein Rsub_09456 [Raphidocelis subcapitata]